MVELSPQPFTTTSPQLVNYDSVDVANGTGYENFYLIESEDSGGKDYHLTPNNDYSNSPFLTVLSSTEDQDYDLTPFTIPRTINGTVLVSLAIDGSAGSTYVTTAEIYKWDGSSETKLGSTVTLSQTLSAPTMIYFRIPITNELIPVGEQLRLRVSYGTAGSTAGYLGIDPAGRTDGNLSITTTSKISVPFKLDI
jgi:hypothetical protein